MYQISIIDKFLFYIKDQGPKTYLISKIISCYTLKLKLVKNELKKNIKQKL